MAQLRAASVTDVPPIILWMAQRLRGRQLLRATYATLLAGGIDYSRKPSICPEFRNEIMGSRQLCDFSASSICAILANGRQYRRLIIADFSTLLSISHTQLAIGDYILASCARALDYDGD